MRLRSAILLCAFIFAGAFAAIRSQAGIPGLWLDSPTRSNAFDPKSSNFRQPGVVATLGPQATNTPSPSASPTFTITVTPSMTVTPTPYAGSPTATPFFSATATATASPSSSPSSTPSLTPTRTCGLSTKVMALYRMDFGADTPVCQPSDYCLHAFNLWRDNANNPPDDIESSYYPVGGPYDSGNATLRAAQMQAIKSAGIGVIIAWVFRPHQVDVANTSNPDFPAGQPYEWADQQVPAVLNAADAAGLKVCFLKGVWGDDTMTDINADVNYLSATYGSHPAAFKQGGKLVVYVDGTWRNTVLSGPSSGAVMDYTMMDNTNAFILGDSMASVTTSAKFEGVFNWDGGGSSGDRALATTYGLKYVPGVRPGWNNTRSNLAGGTLRNAGSGGTPGSRYTQEWTNARANGADWIYLNSFNNWREGTQIEAASNSPATPSVGSYLTYNGDFGVTGAAAETVYLTKTKENIALFDCP